MATQTVSTLEDNRQEREQIRARVRQHRARQISVFGSLLRGKLREDSPATILAENQRL